MLTVRRSWHRPESIEDQVSANIRRVVQVSEPDLVARGIAVDLLPMTKRIGPQRDAAEHKDLSGEKNLALDRVADDRRRHQASKRRHRGTLNESTNVSVKTGGSRIGGPELCVLG